MSDFFIDHSQSGSGANDGTSGTGSWWGYKAAAVEENLSGVVRPGDYIWARRVVAGSPAGELWDAGDSTLNVLWQGDQNNVVNVVRWPASGEPDYLFRPSGSHVDWDSDSESVYPTIRLDGATPPGDMFFFAGGTGSDLCRFVRWRGTEIWSGSGSDSFMVLNRTRVWFEDLHFYGAEADKNSTVDIRGGFAFFKDCEFGTDADDTNQAILTRDGGALFMHGCTMDANSRALTLGDGDSGGDIYLRDYLGNTRAGSATLAVRFLGSTSIGRSHVYSRNGRHVGTGKIQYVSPPIDQEAAFFTDGEDFIPESWQKDGVGGVVQRVTTPVRGLADFSIEATPASNDVGAYFPMTLLSTAPGDEFGGVPFVVQAGVSYDVEVYVRPSGWTAVPDVSVEKPARRGELWVEAEYYTGSGTTRLSVMKYSFSESQTALSNDAWGAVKVSGIAPEENGWALVRAFLGKEEGGSEVLYVDPNIVVI